MSEDLHDIDKLFSGKIDGYREPLPASVWDAVSNNLDKSEAYYYRRKYSRLKKYALLLLSICFVGIGYVLIYPIHKTAASKSELTNTDKIKSSSGENSILTDHEADKKIAEENADKNIAANTTNTQDTSFKIFRNKNNQLLTDATANDDSVQLLSAITSLKNQRQQSVADAAVATTNDTENKSRLKNIKGKNVGFSNMQISEATAFESTLESVTGKLMQRSEVFPLTVSYRSHLFPAFKTIKGNSLLNQTTIPLKPKKYIAHGLSLNPFIAFNNSFDRYEDDDHLARPGRDRHDAANNEHKNKSYSAGVMLSYGLGNKIAIQSGVSYTSSTTSIAPGNVYAKADNNGHTRYELYTSSGYSYIDPKTGVTVNAGDSAKTSGTSSTLSYIAVPLAVSYRIGKGKFKLYPSVGIGFNILAKGNTSTNLSNQSGTENTSATISGLKKNYVDGNIGAGLEYDLTKKVSLSIRPNVRIALTSINQETPVKSYQNFMSVAAGIRIKL